MINEHLHLIILMLSLLTATSILLNIIIIKKLVKSRQEMEQGGLNIEHLPTLYAKQLASSKQDLITKDEDKVFVFLATNCPKCKSKLAMLETLISNARSQGVSMYIVIHDKMSNINGFFAQTHLDGDVWLLSEPDYKTLNPSEISPAYLFIAADNSVEGSGMIDDENWRYFHSQITEAVSCPAH